MVGKDVRAPGVDAHHRDAAVAGVVRLRDARGAMLALRLRPGQVRTLANGLGGIAGGGGLGRLRSWPRHRLDREVD